ncbi:MAG: hypothetical protein OQK92_12750 [Sedimenticola sp.]|nr:hypothetical protein [Sedimenticola sp.]MCW8946789.1 hypothetical protein [Sedimenticola sp.]
MRQHLPRILLTLLGLVLMAWGIVTPMVGLFGETTDALITHVRRQGGERNEVIPDRYTHVISYRFTLPDKQTVEGFSYVLGPSFSIMTPHAPGLIKVRYLPLIPQMNTLEYQAYPNLGHLIVLAVGYLLAFGLWREKKTKKARRRVGTGKKTKGKNEA